ncbi:MAG: PHP domain-containing protein, partial [Bullifex sp.]
MKKYIRYNLHTHSFYCGHGSGKLSEYRDEALQLSLELLGFSEHCPLPDRRFSKSRMDNSMMVVYEADSRAQDSSDIKVLTGYECDWSPCYRSYYEDLLESGRADYLITGTHFVQSPDGHFRSVFNPGLGAGDLAEYGKTVIGAMESGLFSFVAHPDLFMGSYRKWDENARSL